MGKDKEDDCAVGILKTAKGAWQKNVGEVLINLETETKLIKREMGAIVGLTVAVLLVIIKLALEG